MSQAPPPFPPNSGGPPPPDGPSGRGAPQGGQPSKRGDQPDNQGAQPYNQGNQPYNQGAQPYNQGGQPYNQGGQPYPQIQPYPPNQPYGQGGQPYNSDAAWRGYYERPTGLPIGECISTVFRVFKDRFLLLWGLSALGSVPILVSGWFNVWPGFTPYAGTTYDGGLGFPLVIVFTGLLNMSLQGSICYSVYKTLRGEDSPLGETLLQGFRRLPTLILMLLLTLLLYGGVGGIFFGLITLFTTFKNVFIIVLSSIGVVVLGVALTLSISLGVPACMVERAAAMASLKRSREISKGNLLRMLVVFLVLGVIAGMFNTLGIVLVSVVSLQGGMAAWIFETLTTLLMDIPMALCLVALPVMYYQLRSVKENFNIIDQADVFD